MGVLLRITGEATATLRALSNVEPALPALADSSYFIVRGPDRHCRVVDQRPTEKDMTVVGPNGATYHTRVEAMNAMKTVKVCE